MDQVTYVLTGLLGDIEVYKLNSASPCKTVATNAVINYTATNWSIKLHVIWEN